MYVRLGFSVAAHVEPDVLLVDEVLAVGDAQFRQKCADRIEELRRLGTTIVLVAHNLFLVKSICDLGIFLADGEVKAQGDILTAIKTYEAWLHRKQTEPSGLGGKRNDEVAVQPDSGLALTEVELRKLDGSSIEIINFNEGLQVQLHYAAVHPVRQANLVLRIVRSDGVTCCMIRSSDYGLELGDLEGQGIISLAIDPIQLSGGAYTIDARLTGSVDGVPLAQAHSKWFQVAGLSISHTEGSGVFVPKVAWVQTQTAGAVAIAD
jgi:hypothetical protein